MSIQGLGSNWSTNRKRKIEIEGKKREGNKKGKYLPPPSHEALNEKPNIGRDSVEGRTVVVLLKGLYL